MSDLRPRLRVERWVRNSSDAKAVRVHVRVHEHDRDARPPARETLPLRCAHAAGDGGDVFVYNGVLSRGGTPEP